jgi:diguanylate cyclase (GGDEF)-like protein/PAS domain S-box-containing protein
VAEQPAGNYVVPMERDEDEPFRPLPTEGLELSLPALLEQLPDTVLLLDAQGRVRWGNVAAERLFGRELEESVGASALDHVHGDDVELVLRSLTSIQAKELGTLIEIRVRTPEGWRLVELIGRPVPEIDAGSILFSIRDVTDRRRFEVARDDVAKFRSLVQNAAFVMMLISPDGVIESVSAALTRSFGHDPEAVEGRPLADLFVADDQPAVVESLAAAAALGAGATDPVTVKAGCRRYGELEAVPVELTIVSLLEDPTVGGLVVSMRDVTERDLAEQELRQALSLLTATLESTADGILVVDSHGGIVSYNQRFAELWRIPDDIIATRNDARVLSYVTGQLADPDAFFSKVAELYSYPEAESFDALSFRDGRTFERYWRPQRVGDEIVGRVWSFRDVTERVRLEESLAHRALHDSLTGLANKDLFLEQLQRAATASARGRIVAVLFLDVDGLKLVNDRFGHLVGDQLLVKVADILRASVRSGDTVARLGGDEFGVLSEDLARREDVEVLAERILADLPGPFTIGEVPVPVSVSIGIAFIEPGMSYLEVLRHADSAMYSAKQNGRARWELYSPSSAERQVTAETGSGAPSP